MSKVLRRLPSLNGLRAFEAAGRLMSFTLAADELHVTASAISHQIRQLEEALGFSLFQRTARGLVLSEEGRLLLPDVQAGFGHLAAGLGRLEARRPSGVLTVSMLSTFAMRWFLPRLPRFQQRDPDIEVRISTSVQPVKLERDGFDCAIRFGSGDWPDLHVVRLFAELLVPVCSPAVQQGDRPLNRPEDLVGHRLLHAKLRPDDWAMWLHTVGVRGIDPAAGVVFETRNLAIQAAVQGYGVAVVDPLLAGEEITAGRLVRPFEMTAGGNGAYHLVCSRHLADVPRFTRFRDWIVSECQPGRDQGRSDADSP